MFNQSFTDMDSVIDSEVGNMEFPSKFSILIDIASAYELLNQRFLDNDGMISLLGKENTGKQSKTKKIKKSNPLCVVTYEGNRIHQTKHIDSNNNPIWTIDTKSLFVFTTSLDEVHNSPHCLIFDVRNKKDNLLPGSSSQDLRNSDSLGKISIPLTDLVTRYCTGERFEFVIKDEKQGYNGTLVLKFRFATSNDIQLVENINSNKSLTKRNSEDLDNFEKTQTALLITELDETAIISNEVMRNLATGSKKIFHLKQVATKPHPDKNDVSSTEFLSKEELESQTFESPSTNWKHVGSGKGGRVYLEILACHDLPNVDPMRGIGDITDAFVTAIYEDGFVQTPVIQNEISPRWLPWTQRAFGTPVMQYVESI